jgi:hypothetical protein
VEQTNPSRFQLHVIAGTVRTRDIDVVAGNSSIAIVRALEQLDDGETLSIDGLDFGRPRQVTTCKF